MAKNPTTTAQVQVAAEQAPVPNPAPAEQASAPVEQPLSLNEFCIRLSTKDKRVGLIGAFEHTERIAGRMSDTAQNFADRYAKFINQPA